MSTQNAIGMKGRFRFERIHIMKGQIFSDERGEKHKANEQMFKPFKRANFRGNDHPHHPN